MWKLSGFADEISPDLDVQIETLKGESMQYLDLRGVWGKNVLDLTDDELGAIKAALDRNGIQVAAIASPIGKSPIGGSFAPQLDAFRRGLIIAHHFGCSSIRIFSFFLPEGEDPARHRDEVLKRLAELVGLAEASGVTLVHENERGIYGDVPDRCVDLLSAIGSPTLRAVWDPANFVHCGVRPFTDSYAMLRPYIAAVHVKDARAGQSGAVPAGQGDSQWPEAIAALRDSEFDGVFSLEPHLQQGGRFGGFSGADGFRTAAAAFKTLLRERDVAWQ
ncbi:MAG: sugar phosphate isomerase/epimerase family protein [Thermomicrobiales bacterium]